MNAQRVLPKGFIIADVVAMVAFIVVIGQWELVVDIVVIALVEIAVVRRQL